MPHHQSRMGQRGTFEAEPRGKGGNGQLVVGLVVDVRLVRVRLGVADVRVADEGGDGGGDDGVDLTCGAAQLGKHGLEHQHEEVPHLLRRSQN